MRDRDAPTDWGGGTGSLPPKPACHRLRACLRPPAIAGSVPQIGPAGPSHSRPNLRRLPATACAHLRLPPPAPTCARLPPPTMLAGSVPQIGPAGPSHSRPNRTCTV
ncbi:hypothetical protein OsI_11891 [Oryza sativa Indica Group]|uniref:Uncharacterized protein n=1 Tax=Oryza sativa subsp. indica TaxID=39946 RepID=B8AQZ5_ORYSI|nr:hypothetical protein OsI_11891 [Oryza sativa Indica Group]